MHPRLFVLFLASSPDLANRGSVVEKSIFYVFAFPVQIAGCPGSEADVNIKVF